jgi:hypothetical protein
MASPITVGTTAAVVVLQNLSREGVRFQNTSATQTIYLKRVPSSGLFTPVSATDYDVRMLPDSATAEGGAPFSTNSVSAFQAISSAAAGVLAVYETVKV